MAQYNVGDTVRVSVGEISRTIARSRGLDPNNEQEAEVTDVRSENTLLGDVDLYDLRVTTVEGLTLQNVRDEAIKGLV